MKKLLPLLFGGLIALTLFVSTGNTAKAAEFTVLEEPPQPPTDENCTCHELIPLSGADRNKIVAELISSDVFKEKKKDLNTMGYSWNGAHSIEVVQPMVDFTLVGVPFTNEEGTIKMVVFLKGFFPEQPLINANLSFLN